MRAPKDRAVDDGPLSPHPRPSFVVPSIGTVLAAWVFFHVLGRPDAPALRLALGLAGMTIFAVMDAMRLSRRV